MRNGSFFLFFCWLLSSALWSVQPGASNVAFIFQDTGFGYAGGTNGPAHAVVVQHNSMGQLALEQQVDALENTPIAPHLREGGFTAQRMPGTGHSCRSGMAIRIEQ